MTAALVAAVVAALVPASLPVAGAEAAWFARFESSAPAASSSTRGSFNLRVDGLSVGARAGTIDRTSRASVRDAYLNWYLPQLSVPIGWTGNTANCSAGTVSSAAQAATLSMINFHRAFVGLAPVTLNSTYSAKAQQAALMMSANSQLSHSPPSNWKCWTTQGSEAAGSSNLYLGRTGAAAIAGYIVDPGSNNTEVGHRRWILFPPTQQMGSGSTSNANALWVFDSFTRPASEPESVAWPPSGYFPVQMEPGGRWSFTMPGANFDGANVTVRNAAGQTLPVTRHTPAYGYGDATLAWQVGGLSASVGLPARTYTVTVSGIVRGEQTISRSYDVTLFDPTLATDPTAGRFVPITPCRVADTRVTAPAGRMAPGATRTLVVRGSGAGFAAQGGRADGCGIPSNAMAVEASVTSVGPAGNGFVRAWPAGTAAPTATFLNYADRRSTTNTGTLGLGSAAGGHLSLGNFLGSTDAVVDVQGYYEPAQTSVGGAVFVPITPCRVVDTRVGAPLGHAATRQWQVGGSGAGFAAQGGRSGGCGIPAAAVAVEASVSAVSPLGDGYLRAWPSDAPAPSATFLNYPNRRPTTNTGTIALAGGSVQQDLSVANFGGTAHVVVDVQGYFIAPASAPSGLEYLPHTPCRVHDTRTFFPMPPGYQMNVWVRSAGCGVPTAARAVEASVSVLSPSAAGFLRAWPADAPQPNATFLNMVTGVNATNTGTIALSSGYSDLLFASYGATVDLVVDVNGSFIPR